MMPEQKPGRSKQDYMTPPDLIGAVVDRFGMINFDLAASEVNKQADSYYSEVDDSLTKDWRGLNGILWLNPPYENITPWVRKASESCTQSNSILCLVPASVGSNWYMNYVHNKAYVLALNPRITFVGCDAPYPKDCILICWNLGFKGFDIWKWK